LFLDYPVGQLKSRTTELEIEVLLNDQVIEVVYTNFLGTSTNRK